MRASKKKASKSRAGTKTAKRKPAKRDTATRKPTKRGATTRKLAKRDAARKQPATRATAHKKLAKSKGAKTRGTDKKAGKDVAARTDGGPRIPPVARERWTDAMRDVFVIFEGEEARYLGSKFKAVMTLAHHPELAQAWLNYNVFLSTNVKLSRRLIEIVILRVAWRLRSDYEWTQHIVIAEGMGLTDEHFDAIKQGSDAPVWSALERLCIQVVDQLLTDARVEDEVWNRLTRYLDRRLQLELLFVFGTYSMLARIFNAIRIEPEEMSAEERREVIFSEGNVYGQLDRE